jgi:hypothetical protein
MNKTDISLLRMVKGALRESLVVYVPDNEREHVNAMRNALDIVIDGNVGDGGETDVSTP